MKTRLSLLFYLFFILSLKQSVAQNKILLDVKVNGKWGFIDTTGKIVIEPKFDWGYAFNNGSGIEEVKLGGKCYLIDYIGNFINKEPFDKIGEFSSPDSGNKQSKINVFKNGKWGYVDINGNEKIPFIFEKAEPFIDGIAITTKDGQRGYINFEGEFYSLNDYNILRNRSEGFIEVKIGDRSGLFNTSEKKLVLELRHRIIHYLKKGRIITFDPDKSKNVIINTKGEYLFVPAKNYYFTASQDADSLYIFTVLGKQKKKYGVMDYHGAIVIEEKLEFDELYPFSKCGNQTFAVFRIKDKDNVSFYGAINVKGDIVVQPKYSKLSIRREGGFYIKVSGKEGIMDIKENIILPAVYERIQNYGNGIAKIVNGSDSEEKKGYINLKTGKTIWEPSN